MSSNAPTSQTSLFTNFKFVSSAVTDQGQRSAIRTSSRADQGLFHPQCPWKNAIHWPGSKRMAPPLSARFNGDFSNKGAPEYSRTGC
jgi:hypothetical protein